MADAATLTFQNAPLNAAATTEVAAPTFSSVLNALWHGDFSVLLHPDIVKGVADTAQKCGLYVALVFVVMYSAWMVSGMASDFVQRGLTKLKFDATLTKFLAKLVRWGVLLLAALICMGTFGVETTSFAAVIGAMGLAIGLAFQGTLSNFAAGTMLLIFRPYKVGDSVTIGGQSGTVDEIELFTTSIDTSDNRRIIIPNSKIFGETIENTTFNPQRRVDVSVGVSYAADIDETERVLLAAASTVPGAIRDPGPAAEMVNLGASSVDWKVRVWSSTADFGKVKQGLLRAVKNHLDAAGISIPYPHLDIAIRETAAGAESFPRRAA